MNGRDNHRNQKSRLRILRGDFFLYRPDRFVNGHHVGLTGFEPATPWRIHPFSGPYRSSRELADFLVLTGNRAVRCFLLYAVTSGRSRLISMEKWWGIALRVKYPPPPPFIEDPSRVGG